MPRSNRSRSSGRESHRSRTRSRHRSSSRRISRQKLKEKNFWSALCSMVSIVIMCTSLAEPRWISLHGGGCRLRNCVPLDHLGAYQFFYSGHFLGTYDLNCPNGNAVTHILYQYGGDASSSKQWSFLILLWVLLWTVLLCHKCIKIWQFSTSQNTARPNFIQINSMDWAIFRGTKSIWILSSVKKSKQYWFLYSDDLLWFVAVMNFKRSNFSNSTVVIW